MTAYDSPRLLKDPQDPDHYYEFNEQRDDWLEPSLFEYFTLRARHDLTVRGV